MDFAIACETWCSQAVTTSTFPVAGGGVRLAAKTPSLPEEVPEEVPEEGYGWPLKTPSSPSRRGSPRRDPARRGVGGGRKAQSGAVLQEGAALSENVHVVQPPATQGRPCGRTRMAGRPWERTRESPLSHRQRCANGDHQRAGNLRTRGCPAGSQGTPVQVADNLETCNFLGRQLT